MKNIGLSLLLPAVLAAGLISVSTPAQATEREDVFITVLSGDEEVPVRPTRGQGVAFFRLSQDGTALEYKLIVANIHNVVASHIHVAPAGVNGPVVAFLAGPFPPAGGRTQGVLAQGTITAENLVGPLAGLDLSALVAEMKAGNTYVNVHTNDGEDPTNTGPGDFPGGEIRGQIHNIGDLD